MLFVSPIGKGVVHYFTDGRDPARDPGGRDDGRWTSGSALLGLAGSVRATDLGRVLAGRDPATGRFLPTVRPARRRGGWDLAFAAPKSLSLLAAIGPGRRPEPTVMEAHRAAVESVAGWIEAQLRVRDSHRPGGSRPGEGLVGAFFDHRSNAAGEPHLHTHLLIANLTRSEGRFAAVVPEEWFVGRRALAALYHLELRAQLAARSWGLDWRLRADGLADLADIPTAAIRATSAQSRQAVAHGRYEARRRALGSPAGPERAPGPDLGLPASAARAWGSPAADLDDPSVAGAVATRLGLARSDFSRRDVVVALAASYRGGAAVRDALAWADRFCAAAEPVPSPTRHPRWRTALAGRADDRVVTILADPWSRRRQPVPALINGVLADLGGLDPAVTDRARQLLGVEAGAVVLTADAGASALLAQADVLDACRAVWHEAGLRVGVTSGAGDQTTQRQTAPRWTALAGLGRHQPGRPVDVLVVDRADRLSPAEVLRLLEVGRDQGSQLIFVEGGTLPRLSNPASHGLAEAVRPGGAVARMSCGSHLPWVPGPDRYRDRLSGRPAAEAALHAWTPSRLLVGLGIEEVRGLNRAARQLATSDRPATPRPPATPTREFEAGDRVVVLRGGPGRPAYGSLGTILETDHGLTVSWDGSSSPTRHEPETARNLGYGWAVTPPLARRSTAPLLLLGSDRAVPRLRDRLVDIELPDRNRTRGQERGLGLGR